MYQRILIPVDGSDTSTKALVAGLQMARDSGGCVRLVHVVEELAYLTGYEQFGGYSGELIAAMRETANKVLADAMAIALSAGVEADTLLFDNFGSRLAEVVADAAKQWNADLIVVGTHGRRGPQEPQALRTGMQDVPGKHGQQGGSAAEQHGKQIQ